MRTRKIILGDYCCDAISAVMVIYSYIKEIEDRMHIKRSKKGFTLAELLIVVAIIGVLVAISIPIFSGQLEKAREATDAANIRSQYAEVLADAMMGGSVNKDHKDYAPVQLRQQKDEWQSDGLKASLEGVFGEVTGTGPKAAGQAWVEFDAARNIAVLHYDNGSGSSGSGSAGSGAAAPAPTNPTKPIEPTSPIEPETTPTEPTEPETQVPTQPETEEQPTTAGEKEGIRLVSSRDGMEVTITYDDVWDVYDGMRSNLHFKVRNTSVANWQQNWTCTIDFGSTLSDVQIYNATYTVSGSRITFSPRIDWGSSGSIDKNGEFVVNGQITFPKTFERQEITIK